MALVNAAKEVELSGIVVHPEPSDAVSAAADTIRNWWRNTQKNSVNHGVFWAAMQIATAMSVKTEPVVPPSISDSLHGSVSASYAMKQQVLLQRLTSRCRVA